jgi:hypothetical protein
MAVRTGSGDDVIIRQTLTEYLKAHARTEMVRAAFEKVLEQHSWHSTSWKTINACSS